MGAAFWHITPINKALTPLRSVLILCGKPCIPHVGLQLKVASLSSWPNLIILCIYSESYLHAKYSWFIASTFLVYGMELKVILYICIYIYMS